ncbi:MAG: addiction module toxin, HicA family [Cytophagales bacterium]|nr:addiction module toxin, HicA family [Cytophagales bacterium]
MKRNDFIKHLKRHDCALLREGANHSIFQNTKNRKQSAVARHTELSNLMCKKICKQLGISNMP